MRAVTLERAFQTALGGGCHTAFAAHVAGETLHLFHENCGLRQATLTAAEFTTAVQRLLALSDGDFAALDPRDLSPVMVTVVGRVRPAAGAAD